MLCVAEGTHAAPATQKMTTDTTDRLIDFREANRLLSLRCKTAHTVLEYARRGLIEQVRLSPRTFRYTLSSVQRLAKGEVRT